MRRLLSGLPLLVAIIAGALPVSTGYVHAQETARGPELSSVLAQAANRHWYVRVALIEEDTAVGNIFRISSEEVRVADQQIRIQHIQTLERRVFEGGGSRTGAILGATTLGILGGAFAVGFCGFDNDDCNEISALALGASGGAMIGAVLGGLIGKGVRPGEARWIPVWPGEP